jgi:uncharacterized protein (UPF0332 family)
LSDEGKLVKYETSAEEIKNLFELADRDIKDSGVTALSSDRRFATAYNAVLQLSTILLHCKGYRSKGAGHHYVTLIALKGILGKEYCGLADYFDACRTQRNKADYMLAGSVSEGDVEELLSEVKIFRLTVKKWVKRNYPNFI